MAVKIRLKRLGKIRAPYYRIVVADSRTKRDGRAIEEIGQYHPTEHPSVIKIDSERAQYWLSVGAQPTEQVAALLKLTGDWGKFKGDANAVSTVQVKGEKVAFAPDAKKGSVVRSKESLADAEAATKADAEVDQTVADEIDASSTVSHETPEQVQNS
jgi:small subunit ribosomal protein S16